MPVKVNIASLTIDQTTNSPIIILKEENGDRTLPIWIGLLEATAIASELENIKFARPMTHDLMVDTIQKLGGIVEMVEVCDLRDNTFFAIIHTVKEGKKLTIDSRPSDAIALALRSKSPIFVQEQVFEKSSPGEMKGQEMVETEEAKKWTEILENLSPKDFGKYRM
ncbi:MAG: bifunctional nuclease family protein [Candidatus Adiutricales bacterium]|jgi:bifunctional DNase/RNase